MRVFEKQIRHFKKIENMKENNRKMEKICEKCGKNDSNMIEWGIWENIVD